MLSSLPKHNEQCATSPPPPPAAAEGNHEAPITPCYTTGALGDFWGDDTPFQLVLDVLFQRVCRETRHLWTSAQLRQGGPRLDLRDLQPGTGT